MEQWLMMKCAVLMFPLCKLMDLFFYGSLDVQWNLAGNGIVFVFGYTLIVIFLWVTWTCNGLFFCIPYASSSLELWGYKRVEEIIWVKTNQLQRIIRTGRTGHWLNHSKEHCLVGIKGNPEVNRNIDTDVIVAEVRETSRKPDEVCIIFT